MTTISITSTISIKDIWYKPRPDECKLPRFLLLEACRLNKVDRVKQLYTKCEVESETELYWTPFELMIHMIFWQFQQSDLSTWHFILSLLSIEDTTKTFIEPIYKKEHSLLSYLCSLLHFQDNLIEEKISSLIIAGCQWNQEIEEKTALSFFIQSDSNVNIVKWCIRNGANPHKGHLLVHASNWITETQYKKYDELCEYNDQYEPHAPYSIIRLPLPEDTCKVRPYLNLLIFDYLLEIGVTIHDTISNGFTPLLAACCEGNEYKIKKIVTEGASLFDQTKENINAKVFINRQCIQNRSRSLKTVFTEYESAFWTEIIMNLNLYETFHIPLKEMLGVLV
jgi:hypothetical protein